MNALPLQLLLQILAAGAIVTLAALLADHGSRLLRRPARWIWVLAMLLTSALPFIAATSPAPASTHGATSILPLVDSAGSVASATSARVVRALAAAPAPDAPEGAAAALSAPALLAGAWLCASLATCGWLWAGHRRLLRRRRHWREALVQQVAVLVAPDAGPAVVGVLRPRIVLPAAMLATAPSRMASVLAHEQSHIQAGDPRLLAAMLVLLVLMPWQPLLWFQLGRLRRAIEVDCDARVLAGGHLLADYGAALVDCASSNSTRAGFPAMAASSGFLEQRLRLMMRRPARWQRWLAPFMLMLAFDACMAAVAVGRAAPTLAAQVAPAPMAQRQALAGYYQVGFHRVAVVGVSASGLTMKVNLERQMNLLPQSADDYVVAGSDLSVHFDRAAHTLRFRQRGVDGDAAPRVDSTAVEAADAWIAQRVERQQPFAEGAAIIARNLGATRFEQLHAADFTPEFLRLAEPLMPMQQKRASGYGALQELRFAGVNAQGWDRYEARYANWTVNWAIWVDGQGRLAAAIADDMPLK